MKKGLIYLLLLFVIGSCKHEKDPIVAEFSHYRLYKSEVLKQIPDNLTEEETKLLIDQFIQNWVEDKLLLQTAKSSLSLKEQNFTAEINDLKKKLLIEKLFQKLTQDSTQFQVTEKELNQFIEKFVDPASRQKEYVRLNYIKFSKKSPVGKRLKEILFNEEKRITEKQQIVNLCADTIEYYIDDQSWLLLDYINQEFPFEIKDSEEIMGKYRMTDISDENYRYLILFLEYRNRIVPVDDPQLIAQYRLMLQQQKKTQFIIHYKDSLYQAAIKKGEVIR